MADAIPKRRSTDKRNGWSKALKVAAFVITILSLAMTAYQWRRADLATRSDAQHETINTRIDGEEKERMTSDNALRMAITGLADASKETANKMDAIKADTQELKGAMRILLSERRPQLSMDPAR